MDPSQSPAAAAGIFGLFFFIWAGIAALAVALTVFWIVEIVDVIRREFPDPNTKLIWLVVIIFTHTLGAIIYYFAGKPQGWLPGERPLSPYPPAYPPPSGYGQSPYSPPPPQDRQE